MNTGESNDGSANLEDIAEGFVEDFYHDSDDEAQRENSEEEASSLFDLYGNSRPLTPLESDTESTASICTDGAFTQVNWSTIKGSSSDTEEEKLQRSHQDTQRLSTDTIKGSSFLVEGKPIKDAAEGATELRTASPSEPAPDSGMAEPETELPPDRYPEKTVKKV